MTITPLHILLIRRDCDLIDLIFAVLNSMKKVLKTSCTNRFKIKFHETSKCHVKYHFYTLQKNRNVRTAILLQTMELVSPPSALKISITDSTDPEPAQIPERYIIRMYEKDEKVAKLLESNGFQKKINFSRKQRRITPFFERFYFECQVSMSISYLYVPWLVRTCQTEGQLCQRN